MEKSKNILLVKDGHLYVPDFQGKKDILMIHDKIILIDKNISLSALKALDKDFKIIDASGCMIIPRTYRSACSY